ncbi:cupin-like domain-containing protein [Pseudomonas mucidolens]|uniref:cupin-like domain-containing protein n=1 Tax=Pseudomonas mucidolens TaxID=46679 RepID=UPI0030D75FAA
MSTQAFMDRSSLQVLEPGQVRHGAVPVRPFICRGWLSDPAALGPAHPGWTGHNVEVCRLPADSSDVAVASFRLREMGATTSMPVTDVFQLQSAQVASSTAGPENIYVFGGRTPPAFLDEAFWPGGYDYCGSSNYIASAGIRARLHYDLWQAFLLQVHGQKRVRLYPPSDYSFLYPIHHLESGFSRRSRVDVRAPDYQRFPLARRLSSGIEIVLQPGDMLYLPCRWWHEVEALSFSIGFNRRFKVGPLEYFSQAAAQGWECLRGRYWYRTAADLPGRTVTELLRNGVEALRSRARP